jgi:hypothetical protein
MKQRQIVRLSGGCAGLTVEPVMQDRLHATVRTRADFQTPRTGGLHAITVVSAHQTQDAQTGTEALLRMRPVAQDHIDERRRRGANRLGFFANALDRPLGMASMGLRHVLGQRRVPSARAAALMDGDPLTLVEALSG